jgi:hypothetical protein
LSEVRRSSCCSKLASVSDGGEDGWPAKLLPQRLACASEDEAGWPDECWRSLAELVAVLLLVDSRLQCSLDANML